MYVQILEGIIVNLGYQAEFQYNIPFVDMDSPRG